MQLSALEQFESVSLSELSGVSLMDRQETKFVFNSSLLNEILQNLSSNYKVLDIDGKRSFGYDSLYFDTDSFDLYKFHHNGKKNRLKVRFRKYLETGISFFEVKYKKFGTRTIKKRIQVNDIHAELNAEEKELIEVAQFSKELLKSKLSVYYNRITLASFERHERITIDYNLEYENDGKRFPVGDLVIAELKQPKASFLSPFVKEMKNHHIGSLSISKYCIGVALTEPTVKHNNFKPKLLSIQKILGNLQS